MAPYWSLRKAGVITARPPFRPASRPWGECARRQPALLLQSGQTAAQHRRARVNDDCRLREPDARKPLSLRTSRFSVLSSRKSKSQVCAPWALRPVGVEIESACFDWGFRERVPGLEPVLLPNPLMTIDTSGSCRRCQTSEVPRWLEDHPRWTFHFTLTHASWLNQIGPARRNPRRPRPRIEASANANATARETDSLNHRELEDARTSRAPEGSRLRLPCWGPIVSAILDGSWRC